MFPDVYLVPFPFTVVLGTRLLNCQITHQKEALFASRPNAQTQTACQQGPRQFCEQGLHAEGAFRVCMLPWWASVCGQSPLLE